MYNTNSQLVTTMFVWLFLSNVLFSTFVSNTSMKNNRTRNQPVSNTLLGLSTHCRFFYSILFIKNTRAKDNIVNFWRCLLDEDLDYYFHARLWMWTIIHSSRIGMVWWFNYHMSSSFFPQTYSDNGWSQSAILYQHTFIHFSIQWNYPFLVFYLFSANS